MLNLKKTKKKQQQTNLTSQLFLLFLIEGTSSANTEVIRRYRATDQVARSLPLMPPFSAIFSPISHADVTVHWAGRQNEWARILWMNKQPFLILFPSLCCLHTLCLQLVLSFYVCVTFFIFSVSLFSSGTSSFSTPCLLLACGFPLFSFSRWSNQCYSSMGAVAVQI